MHAESAPSSPAPADPAGPAAPLDPGAFTPLPERDPRLAFRLAVAAGVLALALAGFGFYVYRTFFYVDLSPAWSIPPPGDRKDKAARPMGGGTLTPGAEREVAAQPVHREAPADKPRSEEAPPRPDPVPTTAPRPAMARIPAPPFAPREPKPSPDAVATRAVVKPAAVPAESCTEALAAVGLCTPGASPRARTPAEAARKPAAAPQPDAAACREDVAALGLCSPP